MLNLWTFDGAPRDEELVTVLRFADGTQTLAAGDTCLIPAGCRHRVEETSTDPACVWLCVFTKKEVGGWTAGR